MPKNTKSPKAPRSAGSRSGRAIIEARAEGNPAAAVTPEDAAKLATVAAERKAREAKAAEAKAAAGEAEAAVEAPIYVGPKGGIPKVTVKPGRSKFSGTVIVREVAENPRRPLTYGARAFGYYAENVGEAVPFEAFREAVERDPKILGGLNHLNYDIGKGFVRIVPAADFAGKVVPPIR